MLINDIYNKLKLEFDESIIQCNDQQPVDSFILVSPDKLFDICHTLRDDEEFLFDYLMSISGMDLEENLGVVYHLYSMIWRTADWHEREAYDLMGVQFEGHHNLIRILCPYDWEGHPLRKDYVTPETYHNMKIS